MLENHHAVSVRPFHDKMLEQLSVHTYGVLYATYTYLIYTVCKPISHEQSTQAWYNLCMYLHPTTVIEMAKMNCP